jgi:hypothetical protein
LVTSSLGASSLLSSSLYYSSFELSVGISLGTFMRVSLGVSTLLSLERSSFTFVDMEGLGSFESIISGGKSVGMGSLIKVSVLTISLEIASFGGVIFGRAVGFTISCFNVL